MSAQERRLWTMIKERFAIRIDLIGRIDLIEVFRGKYIYSTIPCYSYSEEKPSMDEQGILQIECTEQAQNVVRFDLRKNQIQLSVTPEKLYTGDIVYLLYLLFTKILQEKGYFLIHGSSVACKHKGVLLVGPSESGKTMVSLTLCLRYDFSLVSSDMSLLKREGNEILVVGGTKECSMYPGTMKTVFSGTEEKMFPKSSGGLWDEKIDISETQLQKLGVRYEETVPLTAIYYLRVQDSVFFAKPLDKVAGRIKALSLLSEWIRGANNLVVSTNSLVPSFDTKKTEKERLRALEVISTSVRQDSLYGNLEKVIEFIAKGS